jgi:hypothetical protein
LSYECPQDLADHDRYEHDEEPALTRIASAPRLANAMTHNKKEEITFTTASTDFVKRD